MWEITSMIPDAATDSVGCNIAGEGTVGDRHCPSGIKEGATTENT